MTQFKMPRKSKNLASVGMGNDHPLISFDDLPNEMHFKIFSFLDLSSIHQVRLVSKSFKMKVEASQELRFCCHLTDETLPAAVSSSADISCVKIHDFSGKGNTVTSATRGTGRLLRSVDSIHLIGKNINAEEVGRMMKFAVPTVKELVFRMPRKETPISVFDVKRQSFNALTKLVMGYKSFPRRSHTMALQKISHLPQTALPLLTHFKISYDLDNVAELYNLRYVPRPREVFMNYLAIGNLVANFGASLKTVEIVRNEVLRTALVLQVDTTEVVLTAYDREIVQRCLDRFDDMDLEKLHITPVLDEGEYPWILETALLRRQRNLKEMYLNKKLCSPRLGSQALETILPVNSASFTSVKISLTCMGNAPVDLGPFAECPNLKILWLAFYRGVRFGPARQNSLHFTNLDRIPCGITSLHFKSSQQDAIIIHQQSILTREQIQWIIANLSNLESLWLQLVAEEPNEPLPPPLPQNNPQDVPEHPNVLLEPEEIDVVGLDEEAADEEALAAHQLVNRLNHELNVNANVNVDTFRDLVAMPQIKDMKFDMMRAGQLGAILELGGDGNPWILPMGNHVSLDDIRDYITVCEDHPNVAYTTQTTSFFPFGFVELTVLKK